MGNDTNKINLDNLADSLNIKKETEPEQEKNIEEKATQTEKVIEKVDKRPQGNQISSGPEDIFSDTEIEKPAAFQAKSSNVENLVVEDEPDGSKKKLILLIVVLLGLLGILVAVYFGYSYFIKGEKIDYLNKDVSNELEAEPLLQNNNAQENPNIIINQNPQDVENNNTNENISTPINTEVNKNELLDSDNDGVPDQEEIIRGMNIYSNDSDGDGLNDREEIYVYNTDPTNPDTDGDGFLDGDEVKAGFNPNGPGRLYDINGTN